MNKKVTEENRNNCV